jgi:ATP-dependent Clp protease ATP-binding subunit ClpC
MSLHTNSLILVWRLSELEALNLGAEFIEPPHFLLGLLKSVDLDLSDIVHKLVSSTEKSEIESDIALLGNCFEQAEWNPTGLRRHYRRFLKSNAGTPLKPRGKMKRSESSRVMFREAELLADSQKGLVRPIHLLIAFLKQPDEGLELLLSGEGYSADFLVSTALRLILANEELDEKEGVVRGQETLDVPAKPLAAHKVRHKPTLLLDKLGRDLTQLAREGKLQPVIGRSDEMRKIAQILIQSRKNNVILTGEAGVGKTGIIEGLANRIASGNVPPELAAIRIVEVSMSAIVAGTNLRGDLEHRLQRIIKEASESPDIVIFIDEIHLIMGAGQSSGAMDAANILKPALSRGLIRVIGATTTQEYRRFIEKDAAMERRFQVISVEEPTVDETLEILRGLRTRMQEHHRVSISEEALESAVQLSVRYLPEQRLPDKAIDLIDQACSEARFRSLSGNLLAACAAGSKIDRSDIVRVVSHRCRIPIDQLSETDQTRLKDMEAVLGRRVKGQNEAVDVLCKAIRIARAGLKNPRKPVGVFLFVGATGTGKTELAKALSEFLYGDERRLLRFDMSEYMDEHSVSKLIGSPPGFRDHEEGGVLTEKVRSYPDSIVLFDEIEKAHPKIMDLFLQIFDDGLLTDSRGRTASFRDTIIILTSNLGVGIQKPKLGFNRDDINEDKNSEFRKSVLTAVKRTFKPELINRISEIVVFHHLKRDDVKLLINKFIAELSKRIESRGIALKLDDAAYEVLMTVGYDRDYGARPMERAIETLISKPLSDLLIAQIVPDNALVTVTAEGTKLVLTIGSKA